MKTLKPRVALFDQRIVREPAKTVDPFYNTLAWKQLRQAVLASRGKRCEHPDHKQRIDDPIRQYTVDHIRELRDAPELALDPANVMVVYSSCHTRKTNKARDARLFNR
jgi:5-methylcytosine-specific restriction enzyme A